MFVVCEIGLGSLLRRPALLRELGRRSILPAILPAILVLAALSTTACAADRETAGPEAIALQAVATAIGIAPSRARAVSTEALDFPDASLGCPQPGMAYAQVITPGYRVIVEADGRRFDVRVAGEQGRICYRRKPDPDGGTAGRSAPRESGEASRQDLARRLGIPADDVTVTGLRRLKPGEALAGCGEVCASGAEPASCGVGVRLRVGEQDFDYVALPIGARPCPDIAPR